MIFENMICLSYLGCSSSFNFEFIIHEQLLTCTVCYPAFWQSRDTKRSIEKRRIVRLRGWSYFVSLWISLNFVRVYIELQLIGHDKKDHRS